MFAFAADIERHGLLEKALITEAKRCIRAAVIKTGGKTIAERQAAGDAEPDQLPEHTTRVQAPRPTRKRRVAVSADACYLSLVSSP